MSAKGGEKGNSEKGAGKGNRAGVAGKSDGGKSRGKGGKVVSSVRPVPGPGEGLTREALRRDIWSTYGEEWVLEFYGHRPNTQHAYFSNFYNAPFRFVVPEEVCAFSLTAEERTVDCDFSEKAVMLCKAAAMGDRRSYDAMVASTADPPAIKRMGRQVQGWDEAMWRKIECSVAFEVVYQKFSKVDYLKWKLLDTQNWVLAEATSNDKNWGTGLDKGDDGNRWPATWPGTNMLGWALMQTRNALRAGDAGEASANLASPSGVAQSSGGSKAAKANPEQSESSSVLSEQEKAFMKSLKNVRALLKLEEMESLGKRMDKLQTNKLEGKIEVFRELYNIAKELQPGSHLLEKNKGVLSCVATYFEGGMG